MSVDDDKALVGVFLAERSESRFRALYQLHSPALFRMAYRLLGPASSAHAEDVVQETWVRAITRLPEFEWRSSLRTWLVGILINCAREAMRRQVVRTADPPEPTTVACEPALDLEHAVANLADGARSVFCLHDIEGYTHEEIGQLLGISAGTSKSQLFDARRRLRKHLGGKS